MLENLVRSLKTFFTPNRLSISICILLASIGWFLTKMSKEYNDQISFQIMYQPPNDQSFSFNPPSTLDAEIRAKGWSLLSLTLGKFDDTIKLDQSQIFNRTVSSRLLLAESLKAVTNDDITIVSALPEQIEFRMVERQAKKVPIILNGELALASQYQWKEAYSFTPDSVTIYGAQDQLSTLFSWPTRHYQKSDIHEDLEVVIPLENEAPAITTAIDKTTLSISVDQVTEKEIYVPIPLPDSLKSLIRIFPSEVLVKINLGLSQYDKVTSDDFKLQLEVDSALTNQRKVVVKELPGFATYISHEPQIVDYYRSSIETTRE